MLSVPPELSALKAYADSREERTVHRELGSDVVQRLNRESRRLIPIARAERVNGRCALFRGGVMPLWVCVLPVRLHQGGASVSDWLEG